MTFENTPTNYNSKKKLLFNSDYVNKYKKEF